MTSETVTISAAVPANVKAEATAIAEVHGMSHPRYTMAELLAASDYSQPQPADEREWVDSPAAGRELV